MIWHGEGLRRHGGRAWAIFTSPRVYAGLSCQGDRDSGDACALSQLLAGFAIIPCQPTSGILANFLVVLKSLGLLFAIKNRRKCGLSLMACQKISHSYV